MARLGPAVLFAIGVSVSGCIGGNPVDPTPSGLSPVASLALSSSRDTVFVADTLSLGLVVRDSAGNLLSGRSVLWQSSAPGIASVSSLGVVTGVRPGSASISATAGTQTASVNLLVRRLVFSVNVVPDAVCLRKGFTTFLFLTAFDSLGQPLPAGIRPVTWRTSNGLVLTVSAQVGDSAVVLGVAGGQAFVSGTIMGVADTTGFIVNPAPLDQPLDPGCS